jgi:hypothetical protein
MRVEPIIERIDNFQNFEILNVIMVLKKASEKKLNMKRIL